MPTMIRTRSGRLVEMPTPEEDAIITAAAMSDPDAIPLTDGEWEEAKPFLSIGLPLEEVSRLPMFAM